MTVLAALRMSRAMRAIRLFRVCGELRATAWGVMAAFSTVVWVGVVVLIINFVVASLLTSIVGQKAYLWNDSSEQIEQWFGSIGRSLQTQFSIMTLSGWGPLADVISQVVPAPLVAL